MLVIEEKRIVVPSSLRVSDRSHTAPRVRISFAARIVACIYKHRFHKLEPAWLSQYSMFLRTGRSRFDPRQRQKIIIIFCVQTGSEVHPASCPVGAGGPFPGSKGRPGRDSNHSPVSRAELKERVRAIPPLPPSAYMEYGGTVFTNYTKLKHNWEALSPVSIHYIRY
jgi:hypothetical protein